MEYVLGGLSVLATFLAVGLSVATFRITNRRDDTKWRRDAIVDAMVQFLDGSFQRYSERAWEMKAAGDSLSKYHERNETARRQQNVALTRLRLLASDDVVSTAEWILVCDQGVESLLKSEDRYEFSWSEINHDRQAARTKFVSAYRNNFHLGTAVEIKDPPTFWGERSSRT